MKEKQKKNEEVSTEMFKIQKRKKKTNYLEILVKRDI